MALPTQQSPPIGTPISDVPGACQPQPSGGWFRRRQTLNVLIDVAALLAAGAVTGSGLILAYRLPHGPGNRGLSILGWARHEWGNLHLILGWVVIALMVVHLLLHLNWIMHACATIAGRWGLRAGAWLLPVVILLVTGALIAVPWLLPMR